MNEQSIKQRIEDIQHYYGKTLSSREDLAINVCTVDNSTSDKIKEVLKLIHPDVQNRFYGCGTPFPPLLEGTIVLDLGCGSGRDCFILSHLVGTEGKVIGIDATAEQIEFAQRFVDYHRQTFNYPSTNVHFQQGYIESLEQLNLPPESIDVIVSNCVINLSVSKANVLAGMARLLKSGGEIYFSDIFSDRRLDQSLKNDQQMVCECIGDALYFEDFIRLAKTAGFNDVRIINNSLKSINNKEIEAKLGGAKLYSMTLRLFKLDLEDRCEDYGQVAIYKGNLPDAPDQFVLDQEHIFETGRAVPVCRNTADMITKSRYHTLFDLIGDGKKHYGLFKGGRPKNFDADIKVMQTYAPGDCGC
ncbi:methyltransferase domain-containing protein [Photorhabdus temperata subsp. temperata]|uniref:Arsenite methyltransferase n=1 Tax=Photorhabdus temperata subsp. temperata Meg1 TaxID=1393735 RepID=A0A081RZX5_PHOTE|nr:methyltransferase domain-containing protein [Photorhabdus temperata]KER04228.1 SAM-dependent methyltransferase [Photorhabdus temperata subsp. temperata Meg1]